MDRNFDLAMLAMKSIAPQREILYDNAGLPSVMNRIPKMTYKELGLGDSTDVFPAFIVNGVEVPEIFISSFTNCVYEGRAYSLPGRQPQGNINFENAIARCTAKGPGWHMMTAMEWAALAHWCKANGFMPNGNNDYGKDHSESVYTAIPYSWGNDGKRNRVLTGTGPLTWSHDGTPGGIWDLNGNFSEWNGGIRTVYGEIQVLVNNNAADPSHLQTADSAEWKAISGADGSYITPNGSGTTEGSVKVRWRTTPSNHFEYTTDSTPDGTTSSQYSQMDRAEVDDTIGEAAILKLQALGILRYDNTSGAYKGDYLYYDTSKEERCIMRGGNYSYGSSAGLFYSGGYNARSNTGTNVGFRAAYVKL